MYIDSVIKQKHNRYIYYAFAFMQNYEYLNYESTTLVKHIDCKSNHTQQNLCQLGAFSKAFKHIFDM